LKALEKNLAKKARTQIEELRKKEQEIKALQEKAVGEKSQDAQQRQDIEQKLRMLAEEQKRIEDLRAKTKEEEKRLIEQRQTIEKEREELAGQRKAGKETGRKGEKSPADIEKRIQELTLLEKRIEEQQAKRMEEMAAIEKRDGNS